MKIDLGLENIGDLLKAKKAKKLPQYAWQELALRVIKELNIPAFKRSAVFKVCQQKPRIYIETCLNDTKELCQSGEKWRYFFKLIAGSNRNRSV